MTDAELAADIAQGAGALLLDLRRRLGGSPDCGARADRLADDFIAQRLCAGRPDDALLSEEHGCDGTRLTARRVWIVDPLDGTREFAEGRDDWAVHVGLAINGQAVVGAVALPARGLTLRSDEAPKRGEAPARPRILVSRTRPPVEANRLAAGLGGVLVPMGSAGAKIAAVITGEADIYVHSGGQHQWDNAAPVAVALAAGLTATRIDGQPLRYNEESTRIDDLLVAPPDLHARALAILRS